ncbi:immunoglobulin-like domain-containing protein [Paenibacillus sp. GCM10012307]
MMKKLLALFMAALLLVSGIIPAAAFADANPSGDAHGLRGDYYISQGDNKFYEKKSTEVDSNIDFSNDPFEQIMNERTGQSDNVAVRWQGRIEVPADGDYTFYMIGDNGFRLWIDNELVIDFWLDNWNEEQTTKPIKLEAGKKYNFKVEYYEKDGGQNLYLRWSRPGLEKSIVPASAFYQPEMFYTIAELDELISQAKDLLELTGSGPDQFPLNAAAELNGFVSTASETARKEGVSSDEVKQAYLGLVQAVKNYKRVGPINKLKVHYKLDETTGWIASNSVPTDPRYDGELKDGVEWTTGVHGGALAFGGAGGHIKMPNGILSDVDDFTISLWVNLNEKKPWETIFTFAAGTQKYMILSPHGTPWGNPVGVTLVLNDGRGEQRISTGAGTVFPSGSWQHFAFTLSGGVGTIYLNGQPIVTKNDFTITPRDLGVTTDNFIGKSVFPDPSLEGKLDDFRIYTKALTAGEIESMVNGVQERLVNLDKEALDLGDISKVTSDLVLPRKGANGSSITWTSSQPGIIATDGKVVLPVGNEETVTLTATLELNGYTAVREFTAKVPAFTDELQVELDLAELHLVKMVEKDLILPTSGKHNTQISWVSSAPSVVGEDGTVHRPAKGKGNKTVTLTATVKKGNATKSKTFNLLVMEEYVAYVMSHFKDGDQGENFYLSYSFDGLHWVELNNGQIVLRATQGTKRIRDPYLYRKQDGKFILASTQGWSTDSLYVWDTDDLANYKNERLLKVNNIEVAWAPEIAYDPVQDNYVLYWSHGTIYSNTTKDFLTVSGKSSFFNPGYSVIDASIVEWEGTYYMFYKDERGDNSDNTPYKALNVATSKTLQPGSFEVASDDYITDHLVEGPFVIKSFTENKWYMYYDYFMRGGIFGVSYTNDLASNNWTKMVDTEFKLPNKVRHASASGVTQAEIDNLLEKMGPSSRTIIRAGSKQTVTVATGVEFDQANLPATAEVMLNDGYLAQVPVTWEKGSYRPEEGTYTLTGTIAGSDKIRNPSNIKSELTVNVVTPVKVNQIIVKSTDGATEIKAKRGSLQLLAEVLPDNATNKNVVWTVENGTGKANISETGLLTAEADGMVVVRATATDESGIVGSLSVTIKGQSSAYYPSNGSGAVSSDPVESTDGELTLPSGRAGKLSLSDVVTISIPANANDESLTLSINKWQGTKDLPDNANLVSSIYEIKNSSSKKFDKPVTLTMVYDQAGLKSDQKVAIFSYDEAKKEWVEVAGGKVDGNRITVELDELSGLYAVMALNTNDSPATTVEFVDTAKHWASESISKAISKGIIKGYADGTFKPEKNVTRAEFITMLVNALKLPQAAKDTKFKDTENEWSEQAIAQAVQAGIVNGYKDGTFRPNAEIGRAEMAVMMANALGLHFESQGQTSFADDKFIPLWAKDAVAGLKEDGIIQGKGSNQFDPTSRTTRAEAVVIIVRMLANKGEE